MNKSEFEKLGSEFLQSKQISEDDQMKDGTVIESNVTQFHYALNEFFLWMEENNNWTT